MNPKQICFPKGKQKNKFKKLYWASLQHAVSEWIPTSALQGKSGAHSWANPPHHASVHITQWAQNACPGLLWGKINPEMGFRNTYSADTWPSTPILFYSTGLLWVLLYRFALQVATGLHLFAKADGEISSSVWTSAYTQPDTDTGKI